MKRTVITEKNLREVIKGEDVTFLRLWDLYGGILTDTQREITNLYFNCDLSLGEIAEQKGISRQSVSDCLKKCRRHLLEMEEKLHLDKALNEVSRKFSLYMAQVNRWTEEQRKKHPEWADELDELKKRTEKDMDIIETK